MDPAVQKYSGKMTVSDGLIYRNCANNEWQPTNDEQIFPPDTQINALEHKKPRQVPSLHVNKLTLRMLEETQQTHQMVLLNPPLWRID